MWGIILFSSFFTFWYISVSIAWLILGAIVSPTVFLPYATAATTIVTVISSNYREAKTIIQQGFKTVQDFVMKTSDDQINEMLKKMDLGKNVHSLVNSELLQAVTGQAVKLGVIDSDSMKEFEERALQIASDPSKLIHDSSIELQRFSKDPQEYMKDLTQKMENSAFSHIRERLEKQFSKDVGGLVTNVLHSFF